MRTTAASRAGTCRTRRFARRRERRCPAHTGAWAKTGPLAEAGAGTHPSALSGAGRAAGLRTRRVHGTADAGLLHSAWTPRAWTRTSGSAGGTAIENGAAALDSPWIGGNGTGRRRRRRAVDRPRASLRHDDAARRRRSRSLGDRGRSFGSRGFGRCRNGGHCRGGSLRRSGRSWRRSGYGLGRDG